APPGFSLFPYTTLFRSVLEAIVKHVPPPKGHPEHKLQALIFDSWFDPYRGVVVLTRVFEGTLRKGQKIRLWSNGRVLEVETLGRSEEHTSELQSRGHLV